MSVLSSLRCFVGSLLPALALFSAGQAAARPALPIALLMPVSPACVSSPFGPRVLPNRPLAGTFHSGIDLPAPEGAPVRAIAPGEVIRVQRHGPGGLEMLVQHPGFIAVYSHLGRIAAAIADGRRDLFGGEVIGVVGRTGVTYGMHLYFGMFVDGHPVDPAPYLALAPCGSAQRSFVVGEPEARAPSRVYMGNAQVAFK